MGSGGMRSLPLSGVHPKASAVKREAEEDWGKKRCAAPATNIRPMR